MISEASCWVIPAIGTALTRLLLRSDSGDDFAGVPDKALGRAGFLWYPVGRADFLI